MRLALVFCLAALAPAACNDQGLAPLPSPTPAPTNTGTAKPGPGDPDTDGGSSSSGGMMQPSPAGWGDPTTTRQAGKLRIAQLNVRRFFDTKCDSNDCAAGGFEEVATADAFDKRAAQIADDLATLQADVITLAEVEDQVCLDLVKKKLEDAGFPYPVAHVAESGGPGNVDVAVLARGKLDSVKKYKDATPLKRANGTNTSFTRELPELHLTLGDKKVVVFAAHFRSKSNDDAERRLLEAQAAHDIMVATGKANAGLLVLLGGDLNDTPASPPIDALEKDGALVRVAKDLPATKQGTYKFQGEDQPIDHIFTTKANAGAYVGMSATVVRDAGKQGFAGSDHATIYADFTLP